MGKVPDTRWVVRFGAMQRLGAALGVAIVAFLVQPDSISWHTRIVASWDLGALAYLGLAWTLMARADARVTRDHALSQDQSGYIIFLFVVGASCASIVAIGFVVGTIRDLPFWIRAWHLALTIVALVSSWLLIQTVFAFHYAHRYYVGPHGESLAVAPLLFPGGREPDYADFAYYSFVVGMTSQVSDVAVASRTHAAPDDGPRRPRVPLQYRRARAQHQHHRQRDLAHARRSRNASLVRRVRRDAVRPAAFRRSRTRFAIPRRRHSRKSCSEAHVAVVPRIARTREVRRMLSGLANAESARIDYRRKSSPHDSTLGARRKPAPVLGSNQDLQRESEQEDDGRPQGHEALPRAGIRFRRRKRGKHDRDPDQETGDEAA